MATQSRQKRKAKRTMTKGIANVHASFNNTIVTISDENGDPVACSSAGACGLKGSRKGTPNGGELAAEKAGRAAQEHGVKTLEVRLKGPGAGRDSAVRKLHAMGFDIAALVEKTRLPHNGVRPRKKRRV